MRPTLYLTPKMRHRMLNDLFMRNHFMNEYHIEICNYLPDDTIYIVDSANVSKMVFDI